MKDLIYLAEDFDKNSKDMSEKEIDKVMFLLRSGRNKHLAVLKLLNSIKGDDSGDSDTDNNHYSNIFFYDGGRSTGRRKIRQRNRKIVCCTVK